MKDKWSKSCCGNSVEYEGAIYIGDTVSGKIIVETEYCPDTNEVTTWYSDGSCSIRAATSDEDAARESYCGPSQYGI